VPTAQASGEARIAKENKAALSHDGRTKDACNDLPQKRVRRGAPSNPIL